MSNSTPVTADPSRILDVAIGYMGAQQLFQASRIGLFKAIADGHNTAKAIASATGITERVARILADGMASLDILTRNNGEYALTEAAKVYLTGDKADLDLGPFLNFLAEISYPHWLQYANTVDTDKPGDLGMTEERWGTFLAGVMTYNQLHADMFTNELDLSGHKKLLDLGGLAPYFAMRALEKNPELTATFAYAPDFAPRVEEQLGEAGLGDRTEVISVETPEAKPEGEFDLVFLNHVIHRFSVEENKRIFKNARAAAAKGAKLAVLDFYLDNDAHQRPIDALHAAEYHVIDGTVVFPEDDVNAWLEAAGWKPTGMVALPGSPRVLIAEAV
ncbi:methyltransferase family protein [Cucumibacter marinus]|uniref:methyltransferase family protein n=1 Tax=Cucumibacter marinus TaxID=1121252 RepID=UPI000419D9F0|nr:methyltransferase dimerization domain-containing protein [Cucumibacter marinus]